MRKTSFLILFAAAVVFAAGALVGMVGQRAVGKNADSGITQFPGRSRIIEELKLNPQQQEKIAAIWSAAVVKAGPPPTERVRALEKEREQAILDLLSDDQKAKYNKVIAEYRQKIDALHQPARAAFTEAEELTKPLLDPTQRAKYEETLKRRHRRTATTEPATAPTAAPVAGAR
jgi:hypothetical protein